MDIRHILICSDLSAGAGTAYPHAVRLARAFDARLTLLTVRETLAPGFQELAELTGHLRRAARQREDRLQEARQWFTQAGVAISTATVEGPVAQAIQEYATENRADMIVLGKRGQSGALGLAMGSTTTRVLRHADVPVLVAPSNTKAPRASTETADVGKNGLIEPTSVCGYARIVISTDFSDASRQGLRCALDLGTYLGAKVDLVHVVRLPAVASVLAGEPPLSLGQRSVEAVEQKYRAQVEEQAAAIADDRLASTIAIGSDVAKELIRHASQSEGDLIAIPSTGKGSLKRVVFGSTAERVVKLSPYPVLVLPPGFLSLWEAE